MDGQGQRHETDPNGSNDPSRRRQPGRNRTAPVVAAITAGLAGLWLCAASSAYLSHNSAQCGGSPGWIGPDLLTNAGLACIWPLTGGLAFYTLVTARRQRQWGWLGGLLVVAAVGVVVIINSASAFAHDAVGAVLGAGCSWYWPWVTKFFGPLLVAVACLAYTVRQGKST